MARVAQFMNAPIAVSLRVFVSLLAVSSFGAEPKPRAVCSSPQPAECKSAVEQLNSLGVSVETVVGSPEGRYIDGRGHVWRTTLGRPIVSQFVNWVRQLCEGEASYATACARCHGADGGDRSYPYIKPLPGLGTRLSREQIHQRLNPLVLRPGEISIRGYLFRPAEVEALVLYISGL